MSAERHDGAPVHLPVTLDGLAWRIDQLTIAMQDQAQHIGLLLAGLARLEARMTEHRGEMESVPELVDERIASRQRDEELAAWHARMGWAAKVAATVLAAVIVTALSFLAGRFGR